MATESVQSGSIVTVGVCPCWDITCRVDGVDWGEHAVLDSQNCVPAGKALNISKALAWLGRESVAAGLWGKSDYQQLQEAVGLLSNLIRVEFTPVVGKTRQNITVIDKAGKREMHLWAKSELATREAVAELSKDLERLIRPGSICVFAGAMPEGKLLGDCLAVLESCLRAGARVVVDTSGEALSRAVEKGGLWMIKPNLAELSELAGYSINDEPEAISRAAGGLLERVEIVLVSRGEKGAVAVCRHEAFEGIVNSDISAVNTVGCGDYLLAGFLDGLALNDGIDSALERGLKTAAARAFGWTEQIEWARAEGRLNAVVSKVTM